tara:strand:+ start:59 stop:538 length:480 start_codon:yes stop_codon:yes gene_type:complete
MAVGLLGILGQIANAAKVPISKLTLRMIQNAPMPVRYKKFLQGKTLGEAMIAPSVKAQRAVVPFELKALGVGGLAGVGVAVPIASVLYKNKAPKTKSGVVLPPRPQKRPKSKLLKPKKRPKKPVDIRTETEKMSDRIKKRVATKKTIEKTLKTINKKKK